MICGGVICTDRAIAFAQPPIRSPLKANYVTAQIIAAILMKLFTRTPREKLDGRVYCTSKLDTETCKVDWKQEKSVYTLNLSLWSKTHYTPLLPTFPYIVQSNYLDPVRRWRGRGEGRGEAPKTYMNQNSSFAHQYCATHMLPRYFHFKVHYSLED